MLPVEEQETVRVRAILDGDTFYLRLYESIELFWPVDLDMSDVR